MIVEPPPTNQLDPDSDTKSPETNCQIVQQFEISDPIAKACWYKDGTPIFPKREADNTEDSQISPLQSASLSGDGRFSCNTSNDADLHDNVKGVLNCTYTFITQQVSYMRDPMTQLTVFSLALSKQPDNVTIVMRLMR